MAAGTGKDMTHSNTFTGTCKTNNKCFNKIGSCFLTQKNRIVYFINSPGDRHPILDAMFMHFFIKI